MNTRFYNIKLMPMAADCGIIDDGELWVEGNRIVYSGPASQAPGAGERERISQAPGAGGPGRRTPVWDREIDGRGNLVLPGFKNAHTHSAMTFLRSFADDLPLADWLEKQVFPMEARLQEEDICCLSKLAVMEYLTSGITANYDMYFYPRQIARASVDCGFRTVIGGTLNNFTSSLEQEEENFAELNQFHPLIRYRFGFHAEYTTSRELLEGLARLADKYRAPVFSHNSETKSEVEQCLERNKATPTVFLDSLGLFAHGGGGFHCVYMSQEDLDIFRKKGLWAVTNPGSNTKLASGIAPVKKMLEEGIGLAIGTDGPASNNCLDMFREMFLTAGLAKLREQDAGAVAAEEVLRMACTGGARAMGLSECDSLAPGKLADLIMIDLHQPNMQPENNPGRNLVYSGSKQNVKLTMVDGRILYEDGRFFIGEEPEYIYRKANEIVGRISELRQTAGKIPTV